MADQLIIGLKNVLGGVGRLELLYSEWAWFLGFDKQTFEVSKDLIDEFFSHEKLIEAEHVIASSLEDLVLVVGDWS